MWPALFWDFTQRWLVVSCRRFGTVGGCEILTAVLVKIQVIWDVAPCRLVYLPSSSGPAAKDEGTTFHRNVRNPSTVDRAWSASTPVWERDVLQKTVPDLVTMCDASFTDLWRSLLHSQKPHTGHIFHSLHSSTVCVFFLLHVRANRKNM